MVTLYTVDKFSPPEDWKYRQNFLRLNKEPRDIVFCDGKGNILPLPYDVQAAVLELLTEGVTQRNLAVSRKDELITLRGAFLELKGKVGQMKEEKVVAPYDIPVMKFIALSERVKAIFK